VKEFFEKGVQGVEKVVPRVTQGNIDTDIKDSFQKKMRKRDGITLN
jgi:hypothetical protein